VYGQDYNFDSSGTTKGQTWVSSKKWLVNDTAPNTDFFQLMYRQFGSPAPTATVDTTLTSQLAGSTDSYYYDGNLTINAPAWIIPSGDKVVVFVSGNLTINTPIGIKPGGFIAFIVNSNITVDPSVGVPFASTISGIHSPVLGYNLLWDRKCTLSTPILPSACLAWLSMYSLAATVPFAPIVSAASSG
jgi:hypothetical protein